MTQQNNNQNLPAVEVQIKNTLQAMAPQFKAALPPHITVERFVRIAQTAILTTPAIMKCERNSIFSACLKAAQDGLLPDGKEAALVPFKDKAVYMPMVSGILKKVRNSGELSSITSEIVFEKDSFEYWIDENGVHLKHRPDLMNPERGAPVAVYGIAKTKDGDLYIEVMTKDQVYDVMDSSRSKSDGPWSGPFESEMWRKTVIRRLSKRLPMSTDLEDTIRQDDQFYDFKKQDVEPEKKAEAQTTSSRLNNLMADKIKKEEKKDVEAEVVEKDEPKGGDPV